MRKSRIPIEDRTDHNGRVFDSVTKMCEEWGVPVYTYKNRIKICKWSKEKALTSSRIKPNAPVEDRTDHEGRVFDSIKQMCEEWGVDNSTYSTRIKSGCSKEEALTSGKISPIEDRTDHEGRVFDSIKQMCKEWGVHTSTYDRRIKAGKSKEEALSCSKKNKLTIEDRTDHEGRVFDSVNQMCKEWGVYTSTYYGRIKRGLSKEEALTSYFNSPIEDRTDHEGRVFDSIKQMCEEWGVDNSTYSTRIKSGCSKEEALGVIPLITKRIKNLQLTDNLLIIKYVYSSDNIRYFKCKFKDNKNEILSIDDILNIWRNSNKGGD